MLRFVDVILVVPRYSVYTQLLCYNPRRNYIGPEVEDEDEDEEDEDFLGGRGKTSKQN